MEQVWLDQLISDAERVADAAVRLNNMRVDALLARISEARHAQDAAAREAAYNALLSEMPPVLRALDPITLDDLQTSWVMHRGFRRKRGRSIGFWLLSVVLLVLVGYLTSLHDRATDIAQTMSTLQHARLSEQAVKLFYIARDHTDEITAAQNNGQQTLASQTFFHTLADLQEAQAGVASVVTDSARITREIQFWSRRLYDGCRLVRLAIRALECTDPAIEDVPAAQRGVAGQVGYSSIPPANLGDLIAGKATDAGVKGTAVGAIVGAAPAGATVSATLPPSPSNCAATKAPLDSVYAVLDSADAFFACVGLDQITTRVSSPLNALYIREIQAALSALRSWFIPAAYGSLGAAIFFTRRFLNPALPNPDTLRVIYRILFGGFAGIVFAWFWTPLQAHGAAQVSSFSAFGIAFLAGYSTDILFLLLDRMVDVASQQLRKSTAMADHASRVDAGVMAHASRPSGERSRPAV